MIKVGDYVTITGGIGYPKRKDQTGNVVKAKKEGKMEDKELTVRESRVRALMEKRPEWADGLKELFKDQMTPKEKPRCLVICFVPEEGAANVILAYKKTPEMPECWLVNSPDRSEEREYLEESLQAALDWEGWYGYWIDEKGTQRLVNAFLNSKE